MYLYVLWSDCLYTNYFFILGREALRIVNPIPSPTPRRNANNKGPRDEVHLYMYFKCYFIVNFICIHVHCTCTYMYMCMLFQIL